MYSLYSRLEKGEKLFVDFFSKLIRVYSKVISWVHGEISGRSNNKWKINEMCEKELFALTREF